MALTNFPLMNDSWQSQLGSTIDMLGNDIYQKSQQKRKAQQLAPAFQALGATPEQAMALAMADPQVQASYLRGAQAAQIGQRPAEHENILSQLTARAAGAKPSGMDLVANMGQDRTQQPNQQQVQQAQQPLQQDQQLSPEQEYQQLISDITASPLSQQEKTELIKNAQKEREFRTKEQEKLTKEDEKFVGTIKEKAPISSKIKTNIEKIKDLIEQNKSKLYAGPVFGNLPAFNEATQELDSLLEQLVLDKSKLDNIGVTGQRGTKMQLEMQKLAKAHRKMSPDVILRRVNALEEEIDKENRTYSIYNTLIETSTGTIPKIQKKVEEIEKVQQKLPPEQEYQEGTVLSLKNHKYKLEDGSWNYIGEQ